MWVLWSFPFMACVSFFIIGKRLNHRPWLIWGGVYLIWLALLFAFTPENPTDNNEETDSIFGFLALIWFCSIIHTFLVRRSYINKLIALEEEEQVNYAQRSGGNVGYAGTSNTEQFASQYRERQEQKKEYSEKAANAASNADSNGASSGVVDINSCTVVEMTSLPGVNVQMAKQAMEYREAHGGFSTFEEFADLLKLKPHIYVKLVDRVVCNPVSKESPFNGPKNPTNGGDRGRRLDL